MRLFLTIVICKLIKKLAKKLGRGSSFPGQVALKLYPNILNKIKLPEITIAVTGSNGKTTTAEMLNHVFTNEGYTVAYNYEGSNQIEGITTLILDNCDNKGNFLKDVLLMEVDERYAKYIFKHFTPKYFIINNLYRDQMTRNGHPEYVLKTIKDSIHEGSVLFLNADDPLIASVSKQFDNEVVYFGIDENEYVFDKNDSIYDDGYYCPVCKHKMVYDYRQFGHVGKYRCLNCDFERPETQYSISDFDLEKGNIVINEKYKINLGLKTIFNAYNTLTTFALTDYVLDDKAKNIAKDLNNFEIKNGRVRNFDVNGNNGTLLISKHENTISYNRNLDYVVNHNGDVSLLLIIDDISRKYFTSDTSWLWDISFEKLSSDNVKQIVVAGKYINDVATRFVYGGIDMNKVILFNTTHDAVGYLNDNVIGKLYCLTCFSDQDKLFKEVKVI